MRGWLGVFLLIAVVKATTAQDSGQMQLWMTPDCITKLEVTPKTICHGPDLHHLSCTGFILHYKENCEHWAPAANSGTTTYSYPIVIRDKKDGSIVLRGSAANDGVLGPFSRCSQNFTGDNQPIKSASLSQSGEADLYGNPEDPFGIGEE